MFAWLEASSLARRRRSRISQENFLFPSEANRAAASPSQEGTKGSSGIERTKGERKRERERTRVRGFHNVPVLRRQVSKLTLGKSAFNVLATGREITRCRSCRVGKTRARAGKVASLIFSDRLEFQRGREKKKETRRVTRLPRRGYAKKLLGARRGVDENLSLRVH